MLRENTAVIAGGNSTKIYRYLLVGYPKKNIYIFLFFFVSAICAKKTRVGASSPTPPLRKRKCVALRLLIPSVPGWNERGKGGVNTLV